MASTYSHDMSKELENVDMLRWEADKPYDSLPALPPAGELEPKHILKSCVDARAALATLGQAAELLPNASILINTIPMLEAQASSEIENIVTTADNLFRFVGDDDAADPNTREALRYRQALMLGFDKTKSRPINVNTAEDVCTTIKGVQMNVRKTPGTKLHNDRTREVVYTPPDGEARLRQLLDNWSNFMHTATDVDPLVRMAVGHYQFEAIHPFSDGNGRTGRVLNVLFLTEQELLPIPILYLSRYITQYRQDYYRLLLEVTREENWGSWVHYMLTAVAETSRWTVALINEIRRVHNEAKQLMRSGARKIYTRELLDVIFEQPYCRIENLVNAEIAKRETASKYLKQLVGLGLLEELKVGREILFINRPLMQVLNAN
ncbi:MAG: protein adenylyltransferase Fic [Gemmatimonas sp.]